MSKPAEILAADLAQSSATQPGCASLTTGAERILAGVLADVMHAERVPADSNFFDDLGADSMLMAQFCARVRKRGDLPPVSMKDIYQHPTIRSLATALADAADAPGGSPVPAPAEAPASASTREYVRCGALQLLFFLGYGWVAALIGARAYGWISTGHGLGGIYVRAVLFSGTAFVVLCTLPILAKWVLIGRWKPQQIRIWSLAYVRFWIVKTLIRTNPLAVMFVGSPLYALYLKALGAKVGPRTAIFSHHMPVCTDLLTIGADTVIRKDAFFQCYRAQAGWIQTGPVTVGRDGFIGEKSVLDINTSMGDGAQLGHTSALFSGQTVPDGEHWHGTPAQRTEVNYLRAGPARCGTLRRAWFSAITPLCLFFLYLPLAEGGLALVLAKAPLLGNVLKPGLDVFTSRALYTDALLVSVVLFFGAVIAGLLLVVTVPRVLSVFITPGKVYPLYGFHYLIQRWITGITSIRFFTYLFGDSSYIVHYLRWLGYDLCQVEQTGSNFGCELAHESPYLSSVGSGTMVADGLAMMNADFSSTSFQVSRVSIGPHNFVGNDIAYPAGGRTGQNCLLATKAMIPLDGEIREGVGLLGSPSFEIPRSVERDSRFDHLRTGDELRRRLSAKNRYNRRTMAFYLLARWLHVLLLTVLALAAFDSYDGFAQLLLTAFFVASLLVTPAYFMLLERSLLRFRLLQPKFCSIYDPYFWRVERLWKVPERRYLRIFDGTPFKNLIWRGLGVRIGRRVFDDGFSVTERTLATIGDDCMLNAGGEIQCHSQEDGTFKSDRSTIGAGCTIGVGAMVHYGVTMGDGSVLAPDSFLMKGEEVPPHARWGGNPAREM